MILNAGLLSDDISMKTFVVISTKESSTNW